jgi:hypothetical protein
MMIRLGCLIALGTTLAGCTSGPGAPRCVNSRSLEARLGPSMAFHFDRSPKDTGVVLGKHGEDWTGFDATFGPLLDGTAASKAGARR